MLFHRISPKQDAIVNANYFDSVSDAYHDDESCCCFGLDSSESFWAPCTCTEPCPVKSFYWAEEMPRPLGSWDRYLIAERELKVTSRWGKAGAPRVVLIGGQTPHGSQPYAALYPFAGWLADTLVLSRVDQIRTPRHTLYEKWNTSQAAHRAEYLNCLYFPDMTFVLLGAKVQKAFNVRRPVWWSGIVNVFGRERNVVLLPRPSDDWEVEGARERARKLVTPYWESIP